MSEETLNLEELDEIRKKAAKKRSDWKDQRAHDLKDESMTKQDRLLDIEYNIYQLQGVIKAIWAQESATDEKFRKLQKSIDKLETELVSFKTSMEVKEACNEQDAGTVEEFMLEAHSDNVDSDGDSRMGMDD